MFLIEKKSGGSDRNYVFDVFLVLLLATLVGFIATSGPGNPLNTEEGSENTDEVSMPSTVYNVTSNGVFPYEHTVRPGERVGIYNSVGESITLYSESLEARTVESGGYTVYSLDRIAYFEANTSEGRVGRLKVNVQRP